MIATLSGLVYLLCFLTAALCAALLVRRYFATPSPVLLWSAACFVFLALTNLLVVVDRVVLPEVDLRTERLVLTLLAVAVLLFGFIWEAERD
ncbi:MAG: hypothetical protein K2Y17_08260 [Qipengyuania sp.]|jgi:hypothetical protein|nr:hypothetical protein [Qipengyuania sp.]